MKPLGAMPWPMPVPLLWWVGDYADIREHIRRNGRLDTNEVWEPHSGDSWEAFCGRHGTWAFDLDHHEMLERERGNHHRITSERARAAQESWETAQRQRQQAKQHAADQEWQAIDAAKAYWSEVNVSYANQTYHAVHIGSGRVIDGVALVAGNSYWVPWSIVLALANAPH